MTTSEATRPAKITSWPSGDDIPVGSVEVNTPARYRARALAPYRYRLPTVGWVRLSQFRELMADEFGAVRARSLATDHVFAELDGQTVEQALEAGWDARDVWRAVCVAFEVPRERR
jgi:DUF3046 family protein